MLQVSNIGKRYGDVVVLQDVSFVVNPGDRLGLIGPNGCGKTTLLRIIVGEERADTGSVQFSPPGLQPGYLEQGQHHAETDTLADFLRVGDRALDAVATQVEQLATALATAEGAKQARLMRAYDKAVAEMEALNRTRTPAHEAESILAGLGLAEVPLDTLVATLSGGQKTRLGLARILAHNPQLLLLDEPTNHLDIDALEWLEEWLQSYRGAALIVSHDRTFLERTVSTILELDPDTHTVIPYPGTFEDYVEAKVREREKQWAAYKDQQDEIARLRGAAARLRGQAKFKRGGKADSGDKFAKGFFSDQSAGTVGKAKHIERRIEQLLTDERVEKPTRSWQMKLAFEDTPASGKDVLILEDVSIGYGGVPLARGIDQVLRAGERVALIGPNGAGKTTLLRAITGEIAPLAGEIRLGVNVKLGYHAQEQETLDPESTPLETITRVAAMSETDVRSFLHYFLFSGDEVFVPIKLLSYGERARLTLARLVATGCNFLMLDEPINHLDIPSRSKFEQAMRAFEGTALAVVHDRYFIRGFATRIWAIHDGTLRSYVDLEQQRAHAAR
jgi:ATPase subunit of ABC transporter with duplicated ATPase domains